MSERIEAALPFLAEFDRAFPIQAAFWVREADTSDWMLYVASPLIDDDNFDLAYAEVLRIAADSKDPYFDPFLVKVVNAGERAAQDALKLQRRYSLKPAWDFGPTLGRIEVEGVYVYPAKLPAPAAPPG